MLRIRSGDNVNKTLRGIPVLASTSPISIPTVEGLLKKVAVLGGPLEAAGLGSRVVVPNSDFSSRDFDRIPRWNLGVASFKSMTNLPQNLGNAPEPSGNAGSAAFLIRAL